MLWHRNRVQIFSYLGASAFCGFFAFMYYQFSRGLRSNYMTFLFLWPLAFVALWTILTMLKQELSGYAKACIANSCLLITLHFALLGIYEMAETASSWLYMFLIIGAVYLLAAPVAELIFRKRHNREEARA
ncbi:MAG: hypothetical protein K6F32_05340 [Bacilli bacterium]|nr:hypothetical protein [Bacilli bacterium]